MYFDALWGKVRENGQVAKVAVYLAWGSRWTATRRCWGCGPPPAKGPSSGCTC